MLNFYCNIMPLTENGTTPSDSSFQLYNNERLTFYGIPLHLYYNFPLSSNIQ